MAAPAPAALHVAPFPWQDRNHDHPARPSPMHAPLQPRCTRRMRGGPSRRLRLLRGRSLLQKRETVIVTPPRASRYRGLPPAARLHLDRYWKQVGPRRTGSRAAGAHRGMHSRRSAQPPHRWASPDGAATVATNTTATAGGRRRATGRPALETTAAATMSAVPRHRHLARLLPVATALVLPMACRRCDRRDLRDERPPPRIPGTPARWT